MEETRVIVAAMAAKCRDIVRRSNEVEESLPKALHPKHLLWMCDQIQKHSQEWPVTRLHRWIGFVQAAILANRMLNLEETRAMFDELTKSHDACSKDQDLIDHLDVDSSFKLDLGGQG
jgi:hypothetical protein